MSGYDAFGVVLAGELVLDAVLFSDVVASFDSVDGVSFDADLSSVDFELDDFDSPPWSFRA